MTSYGPGCMFSWYHILRRTLVHWKVMQLLPKRRLKRIVFPEDTNDSEGFVTQTTAKIQL